MHLIYLDIDRPIYVLVRADVYVKCMHATRRNLLLSYVVVVVVVFNSYSPQSSFEVIGGGEG